MVKITSFRFLKESLDALMAFTAKAQKFWPLYS